MELYIYRLVSNTDCHNSSTLFAYAVPSKIVVSTHALSSERIMIPIVSLPTSLKAVMRQPLHVDPKSKGASLVRTYWRESAFQIRIFSQILVLPYSRNRTSCIGHRPGPLETNEMPRMECAHIMECVRAQ
jgi:hypothetical protein